MLGKKRKRNPPPPSTAAILELPPDILRSIFPLLSQPDLKSASLVSKLFLALTSPLILKLTSPPPPPLPSDGTFRRLFARFTSVTTISLSFSHIDRALIAIATSDLTLKSLKLTNSQYPNRTTLARIAESKLKDLKSLQVSWFYDWGYERVSCDKVIAFIQLFPILDELDIGHAFDWDDSGIHKVTAKLPDLKKINLDKNWNLSDNVLDILSKNCLKLEDVSFNDCLKFSVQGFSDFLRRSGSRFRHVRFPKFVLIPPWRDSVIQRLAGGVSTCKHLCHLVLDNGLASDVMLKAVAGSCRGLLSFRIGFEKEWRNGLGLEYSMDGLSELLKSCRRLQSLEIELPTDFSGTQDLEMGELVGRLCSLRYIKLLCSCSVYPTLFSLIRNCQMLKTVQLKKRRGPKVGFPDKELAKLSKKNNSIELMELSPSPDYRLCSAILAFCPKATITNI